MSESLRHTTLAYLNHKCRIKLEPGVNVLKVFTVTYVG
jgi:hypothetical protein